MAKTLHGETGQPTRSAGDRDVSTEKVVLIELTKAAGPISAAKLSTRTLLSQQAVSNTLKHLTDAGICSELPEDEHRPPRYQVESSKV